MTDSQLEYILFVAIPAIAALLWVAWIISWMREITRNQREQTKLLRQMVNEIPVDPKFLARR